MDISDSLALVTGGAGFIGARLTEALLARHCRVRVLDSRPHDDGGERGAGRIEIIRGDVRDPPTWARALLDIDVVFHLAAVVGPDTDARRYLDVNAGGTAELYRALEDGLSRVKKVVVASSLGVYGEGTYRCERDGLQHPGLRPLAQLERRQWEPACPACGRMLAWVPTDEHAVTAPVSAYAVSKFAAERLALLMGRRLDVPTVALRYAVVYGPGQSLANPYSTVITAFATRLARGEAPTLYEDGEQRRDWVYVEDAVRATLLAAEDERAAFEVCNVGSGTGCRVRELAEHLGRRLGRDIPVEPSHRYRLGDYRHLVLDITKLRALGFEPAVSLEEGLDHFVRWLERARDGAGSARGALQVSQAGADGLDAG